LSPDRLHGLSRALRRTLAARAKLAYTARVPA